MTPLPPTRPNPSRPEEDDGPPVVKVVLLGAPFVAAFMAAAVWAPWVLMVGFLVLLFGMISWCVGLLVTIALEVRREGSDER
jgi:uncharacterized protein (DUF983 family)